MDASHYIGIDISYPTFDAAIFSDSNNPATKQFGNDLAGFEALLRWLNQPINSLHFAMVASNIYWQPLALLLSSKKIQVSVVNPNIIKDYANSLHAAKIDAQIIASFCANERPATWQAPDNELLELFEQLEHLKQRLQTEKIHLTMHADSFVMASCQRLIDFLTSEIQNVKALIQDNIDATYSC